MKITSSNYKQHKSYNTIKDVVTNYYEKKKAILPWKVFLDCNFITKRAYESWLQRKLPFFEKGTQGNLATNLDRLCVLKHHCEHCGLPSFHVNPDKKGLKFTPDGFKPKEILWHTGYRTKEIQETKFDEHTTKTNI